MSTIEVIGLALERSLAENHDLSVKEQMSRNAPNKITAIGRVLPRQVVSAALGLCKRDIRSENIPRLPRPMAYGCESVIYKITPPKGSPYILKLATSRIPEPEAYIEQLDANHKKYERCFGDIVVPRSVFTYSGQFDRRATRVGITQDFIAGNCLFENIDSVHPDVRHRLREGSLRMTGEYGGYPDFDGNRNILATRSGNAGLIDTGCILSSDELTRCKKIGGRLNLLGVTLPELTLQDDSVEPEHSFALLPMQEPALV